MADTHLPIVEVTEAWADPSEPKLFFVKSTRGWEFASVRVDDLVTSPCGPGARKEDPGVAGKILSGMPPAVYGAGGQRAYDSLLKEWQELRAEVDRLKQAVQPGRNEKPSLPPTASSAKAREFPARALRFGSSLQQIGLIDTMRSR